MEITQLDHIVLTVVNIDNTVRFYESVLGMTAVRFAEDRVALTFGSQKINLHQQGHEFEPKAHLPQAGSADLCFITTTTFDDAMTQVENAGIEIIAGPVTRTGALGPILSFYFRDPDKNLIEVANYSRHAN